MGKRGLIRLVLAQMFLSCSVFGSLNDGLIFALDFSDKENVADAVTRYNASPFVPTRVRSVDSEAPVKFIDENVPVPYWSQNAAKKRTCLLFNQPTKKEDSTTYFSEQSIQYGAALNAKYCTVYVRFRWDGAKSPSAVNLGQNNFIALNGYNYSGNAGWAIGLFREYQTEFKQATPLVSVGKTNFYPDKDDENFRIPSGTWCDMAIVFKEDETKSKTIVTIYLCKSNNSKSFGTISSTAKTLSKTITLDNAKKFHIGTENAKNSDAWTANVSGSSKHKNSFRGAIADFKVWNRAMDANEIEMLLREQEAQKWAIGAANASAGEFNPEATSKLFDPAVDSWTNFPSCLENKGDSVTISSAWPQSDVDLTQVLRIDPILPEDVASCPVSIKVNGGVAVQADLKLEREILIPSALVKRNDDGKLILEIQKEFDGGSLGFDALSLSGAFSLGTVDNKNDEFAPPSSAPKNYIAGSGDASLLRNALGHKASETSNGENTSNYSNVMVTAYVPAKLIAKGARFSAWINCGVEKQMVALYANGKKVATWIGNGSGTAERFTHLFESGDLEAGYTTFELRNESIINGDITERWATFDRLSFEELNRGIIIILR